MAEANDKSGVVAYCTVYVISTPVESIAIESPTRTTFKAGETIQLSAIILPENATDKTISWASSNPNIITVDSKGLATAISVGGATITATSSAGQRSTVKLTVIPTIAESLSVSPQSMNLKVGERGIIAVTINPNTTTNKTLTYSSTNEAIATVSAKGQVIANAPGECEITVTTADGSDKTASCHITVYTVPAESISIDPKGPFTLRVGETIQLSATVLPEDATDKSVSWESQTGGVSIDANGLATAVAPVENNWIRATNSAGQTDHIFITVIENAVAWSQEFEYKPSDRVELTAGDENSSEVSYRGIKPDGGFQEAQIENVNGKWYATFPTEGAYILEAYFTDNPDIKTRKTFNVVNPDDLIYVDGIYYRYTDSNRNALKVVRGYKMYSGDYTIPALVNGLEVKYIDNDAFASCTELGKIIITDGITELRSGCFSNGSISAIDIPASVKVIEEWTFNALDEINGHYSLMSISLRGVTPVTVNTYIFNGYINYDLCELHVPIGTKQAYATAEVWKEFKTIIDDLPIDDTPDPVEVESVEILQGDEISVKIGQDLQLTAKVLPEDATDKSIEWRSEDENVATVTATDGLVNGLSVGMTRVFAISKNGKQDVITVTVLPIEADNIEINLPNAEMTVGQTMKAEARISPENTTDRSVEWSVSDTSIISVDEAGVVTAISRGQAYLFAKTINGIIASALITVKPIFVQSITIPSEMTVETGSRYEFTPVISPDDASEKRLVWESSNPSLGSFAGNVFYAHVRGEITATCRAIDGSDVFAQCHIKIVKYATSLTLNEHEQNLKENETFRLVAAIEPIDAIDSGSIVWTSSDETVVNVDKDGLITALSVGESVVKAETQNYPWLSDECIIKVLKVSGVETITIDESSVVVDDKTVTVDGLPVGAIVSLIDLDGHVRIFTYTGEPMHIRVEQSGIYILNLGKYSLKIAIL